MHFQLGCGKRKKTFDRVFCFGGCHFYFSTVFAVQEGNEGVMSLAEHLRSFGGCSKHAVDDDDAICIVKARTKSKIERQLCKLIAKNFGCRISVKGIRE